MYKATFVMEIAAEGLPALLKALAPFGVAVALKLCPISGGTEKEATAESAALLQATPEVAACAECGQAYAMDWTGNRYCRDCLELIRTQSRREPTKLARKTRRYQPRICQACGAEYTPTGSKQRVCPDCKLVGKTLEALKAPQNEE